MPSGDFEFVDRIVLRAEGVKATGLGKTLKEEETHAIILWASSGIIGNGSFQYFFENGLSCEAAARSYRFIGLPAIAEIFNIALSLFPNGKLPESWPETKRAIESKEKLFDQLARQVVGADSEMTRRLAEKLRAAGVH
jgi:hypothetical protein